jgi:hypothetical protein
MDFPLDAQPSYASPGVPPIDFHAALNAELFARRRGAPGPLRAFIGTTHAPGSDG